MKQRRQIRDFRARQLLHDRRQDRQLMVVARNCQAPQVTQYEQRVRVDGVGVKQVILHPADDAAKRGNVAA
jgi:hypothetical protein